MRRTRAAYGSWESPISADLITRSGVGISGIVFEESTLYWLESRPSEGGRGVVVCQTPAGQRVDVTPPEFNARSSVHEYGGGAFTVHGGIIYFVNWSDQRIYRHVPGDEPRPLSPDTKRPRAVRYADLQVSRSGRFLVAVWEKHPEKGEPINEIVLFPTDGSGHRVIASGRDFYSSPRISPADDRIAWLEWDHPNMPWDETELFAADFSAEGQVGKPEKIAGEPGESIFQPDWSPDGDLHYVSDRAGFWNLYACRDVGDVCLRPDRADSGLPQWQFGMKTYCFFDDGRIVLKQTEHGRDRLLLLSPVGTVEGVLGEGHVHFDDMASGGDRVYVVATATRKPAELALLDDSGNGTVLAKSLSVDIDPEFFSEAEPIEFATDDDETAHAFFYPPTNPNFLEPKEGRPPLVVLSHGGPTSARSPALNLGIQYLTSRGIAVVDVNYRGSTGYGRAYRDALKGNWGVADVADCANAAKHLAAEGRVDGKRMAIAGGSAGGYTTLSALTFTDVFAAGVSRYGVADLEALAKDTHKFESRYLDGMIGPYPKKKKLYRERSPIHHTDRLSCPILVLQGLEDAVVPPAQAEAIVAALAKKGIPHAYLPFEGEQHGFRKAENIRRSLEAELSFYGQIFGFEPAGDIEPVTIENLGGRPRRARSSPR